MSFTELSTRSQYVNFPQPKKFDFKILEKYNGNYTEAPPLTVDNMECESHHGTEASGQPSAAKRRKQMRIGKVKENGKVVRGQDFSRYSNFSRAESKAYITLWRAVKSGSATEEQHRKYNEMKPKVEDEQREFRNIRKVIFDNDVKEGRLLAPSIRTIMEKWARQQHRLALETYSAWYSLRCLLDTTMAEPPKGLRPQGSIAAFRAGTYFSWRPVNVNPGHYLPPRMDPFDVTVPKLGGTPVPRTPQCQITADPLVKYFVSKSNMKKADFAFGVSALKHLLLMSTEHRYSAINIPFEVQGIQVTGTETICRIILIDKPLPPKQYSCRQLSDKYYKELLLRQRRKQANRISIPTVDLKEHLKGCNYRDNVNYTLHSLQDITFVLRYTSHTVSDGVKSPNVKSTQIAVTTEFINRGYEMSMEGVRLTEIEEWPAHAASALLFSTCVRESTQVLLHRINPFNTTITAVQNVPVSSVLDPEEQDNLLDNGWGFVYSLLKSLKDMVESSSLPNGSYLLSRSDSRSPLQIFEAVLTPGAPEGVTETTHIDLSQIYQKDAPIIGGDEFWPPSPVVTHPPSDLQSSFCKIPCTFPWKSVLQEAAPGLPGNLHSMFNGSAVYAKRRRIDGDTEIVTVREPIARLAEG